MKFKENFLGLIFLLLITTISTAQNSVSAFVNDEGFNEADFIATVNYIETILYNPNVIKKVTGKNKIEASAFHSNNTIHFKINLHKEQLHSNWISYYFNNTPCDSGSFKKGVPDGKWKTWYSNGQVKSIRNYSANKYHFIKADINRNHPRVHKYKITEYHQNKKQVKQYFVPDFDYNNTGGGLMQTIIFNTQNDGEGYKPPYTSSLHHGEFVNFYEDGSVKDSGHYVDGLKHGIWVETEKKEPVRSVGYYQHGFRHGQWKHYKLEGALLYIDYYKHGKIDTRHHFDK